MPVAVMLHQNRIWALQEYRNGGLERGVFAGAQPVANTAARVFLMRKWRALFGSIAVHRLASRIVNRNAVSPGCAPTGDAVWFLVLDITSPSLRR